MPDVDCILQVERSDEFGNVGRVSVHFVAFVGLGRPTMPTPIVGYHAIALVQEEEHLIVPVVGTQWPAMMKNDRLPGAPVLVENLCAVFGGDRVHGQNLS